MAKRDPQMKTVAYIHGLNSSHRSFGYLTKCFPDHNIVRVNYDSHQPLKDSILQVGEQLPKGPIALVGHSLGGLIASLLVCAQPNRYTELVTISSPLGGSRAAQALRWVPGHLPVLESLTPQSVFIRAVRDFKAEIPTLSIISTGGHLPTSAEKNDSVVTVLSQRALPYGKKIEVKANHFEILMHEKTVEHVRRHLFGDQS
jgi:pimeloyl-ACP methyl ester carboxylesterase